jgi:hypothetical protein
MNLIEKELGRVLSAKELSEFLEADEKTIRKYYQRLGGIRIGSHYKFFEKEVINAIQTRNKLYWTTKEEQKKDRESIQEERGCEELGSQNADVVKRRMAQKDKHGLLN